MATTEDSSVKVPTEASPKKRWPLRDIAVGLFVTVVGGLILWRIVRELEKPTPSTATQETKSQPQIQPPQPESKPQPPTSPQSARKSGDGTQKVSPAKPQQDNSVHVGGGSSISQSSTGDCSPNMIGGSNTVNCGPQAIKMEWTTRDINPPVLSEKKHEFKYEKQITVKVNTSYTPVSLGIVCDAEIEEVNVGMVGPYMLQLSRIGIDRDNKRVGFVYFEGTPATPDRPLFILVWSSRPFSVLEVRQAKINSD